jgi:PAS domain S-box-containing protein
VLDITRQQQYKDALREEENLLARIFDTSAAAINVLDTDGRIVRANGRAKEVLGLTPSAMEGRLYDDPQWNIEAVDGGPFPHDELPFHRVMATEAPVYNVRHAITWPNGQRRVLSISGGPLHDEDGTVEGAVFIISDVTDQHEQDKAFRDQQRRLEMALSGGNVGMWDWDMKTGVVTYDERWAAMLGYDLSEVDDHQSFFESRTHPDDFDRLQAAAARHAEGQTPHIDEEIRVRHRDGTWRWGLDRAKIMEWDADGSPRRMVGTHLDITARKRAEQALRQQRDLLNQTQRLAGAWELDLDTDRVTFSEEIIRILEWPADKPARFGELGHLFTPSTREKLRNAVQAACEHGTPYDLELPLTTVGGNKRWIRTVAAPIERDGTIVKLAGAMQDITERKHHEEALRRERDLLQNIFDASPAAIVTTNADGDFTAASLKAQQVLDLTPSEVQARSFNDPQWRITDPEGDPIPDEELPFAQVKDTGAPLFEHEQTIEWPDGAHRLLSVSGAPLTGANGQFDGAVFVIDDITERRRRESIEERFGRILQTVPSEIYIFDADTLQFVQTSKGAQVNLGYSADELATLTPVDLQPRDRSAFEALIAPLRAGSDDVVTVETTHRRNDGTTYPVELRLQYNHSEPQPVFIAIGMDISERVAHEAALRRGKRYAERLIESMQDGFSVIGAGGVQVQVNEAFCEMTGFREDELLGEMPPYPYWADGEHETIQATLHRAFEGDTGDVELIFQTKSGDRFPVLVSPTRLTDTVGEPVYYFATVKDISDRKKYENGLIDAKQAAEAAQLKAEEMNRLKDAFLANMSHEIRTPLTAILGLTDVLEGQLHGKQSELVMMVREAGQRLERTLTSVLDLAELESHSVQMQPDEIDLTREVRQALSLFSRQADEKGLRLVTDFPGQPVSVTLDVGAVQRILTNLISNAIKFTDGGFVRVGVHPGRTRVVIEVEDSGIGIEPDYVDKIFQEFTQESAGYTRAYEGVGLGLHITKRLVEVLGGQIALQSVKGEGTTFTVTLPYTMSGDAVSNGDAGRAPQPASPDEALMGSPNAAPSVSGAPDQPPPGEQLPAGVVHLLLVDDNALSRELFPLLMEEIAPQYVVDVAKTGEEALVRAAAAQYDGFVIDINLGEGMNGVDLMHELRAGTTYATTPMMACTAYALPDDEERLLSEGFNTYLSKPYRTSGLLAALQHMFAPDPGA